MASLATHAAIVILKYRYRNKKLLENDNKKKIRKKVAEGCIYRSFGIRTMNASLRKKTQSTSPNDRSNVPVMGG
jgi:hypothetical protein